MSAFAAFALGVAVGLALAVAAAWMFWAFDISVTRDHWGSQ